MSMMAASPGKPRASLDVKKTNHPKVLARAKIIYAQMLLNVASFVSPTVALSALLALIQAYDTAQQNVPLRTTGLAAARTAAGDKLWTALVSLKAYVQSLVDALPPEAGVALIQAAGMVVSKVPARVKLILTAALTTVTGTVHLVANEEMLVGPNNHKKVTFNWRASADGGTTWINGASTPTCETDFTGLTLNTKWAFQVSVTVGKSKKIGPWTDSVTVFVH